MKLGKRILALTMAFAMCFTSSLGTVNNVSATEVNMDSSETKEDGTYIVSLSETENGANTE